MVVRFASQELANDHKIVIAAKNRKSVLAAEIVMHWKCVILD